MSKMFSVPYWSKQRILNHAHTAPLWIPEAVDSESGPNLDRAIVAVEPSNWFCRPLLEMEIERSFTGTTQVGGDPEEVRRWIKRDAIKYNTRIIFIISRDKGIRLKDVMFAFVLGNPSHLLVEPGLIQQMRDMAKHLRKSLKDSGL